MEDVQHFKDALLSYEPIYIYRKYLLGHDVWYFRNKLKKVNHAEFYDDFKICISEKLEIHINNIAIVGSAKLGFSITPTLEKAFKDFNKESDLDLVVVSSDLFRIMLDGLFGRSKNIKNTLLQQSYRKYI